MAVSSAVLEFTTPTRGSDKRAEIRAKIAANRAKRLRIAAAMKQETGVTQGRTGVVWQLSSGGLASVCALGPVSWHSGLNIGSRVTREGRARFWDLGVQFPRAARRWRSIMAPLSASRRNEQTSHHTLLGGRIPLIAATSTHIAAGYPCPVPRVWAAVAQQ